MEYLFNLINYINRLYIWIININFIIIFDILFLL